MATDNDKSKKETKRTRILAHSDEFDSDAAQEAFNYQLDRFNELPRARDGGDHLRFTNITGRYSQLPKRVIRRPKNGGIVTRNFRIDNDSSLQIEIKPTLVDRSTVVNGVQVINQELRYPMILEDRVEDALAYLAAQGAMRKRPDSMAIEVRFSLSAVKKTIQQLFNKNYTLVQIRQALIVLANAPLNITDVAGTMQFKFYDTRISNLVLTSRADWEQDSDARCYCKLHPLFAFDISRGDYTVHDLEWQGRLDSELAQDLFKYLSYRYRNANHSNSHTIMAKHFLENNSIGFYEPNPSKSWTAMTQAMKRLQEGRVILKWTEMNIEDRTAHLEAGRPRVIDKRIEIFPSEEFIKFLRFSHYADKVAIDRLGPPLEQFEMFPGEGF